jgi:hypothetical protein
MIDTEVLVDLMKSVMTKEQLEQFVEGNSEASNINGTCLLCGKEDMPVDNDGKEIEGDDVSEAAEFEERHTVQCPITRIEAFLKQA